MSDTGPRVIWRRLWFGPIWWTVRADSGQVRHGLSLTRRRALAQMFKN